MGTGLQSLPWRAAGCSVESGAFGAGDSGRIHITEAEDPSQRLTTKSPLAKLQPGEAVKAVVIGVAPLRQVST